jgi:uncharacterized protein YciI
LQYYALFYRLVDDHLARRAAYREEHLRLAQEAHARGELVLAGAFADSAGGALLVFYVDDPGIVENFARHDPYVTNGLVVKWEVRPWTVVIGDESQPAKTAQRV